MSELHAKEKYNSVTVSLPPVPKRNQWILLCFSPEIPASGLCTRSRQSQVASVE